MQRKCLYCGKTKNYNRKKSKSDFNTEHVIPQAFGLFEAATPFDTPRLMNELVSWYTSAREVGRIHPLIIIAVFIVVFLEIYPFQDGTGRLSRALTTLLLLKAGYIYVPYSSLESVVEQSKEGSRLSLTNSRHAKKRFTKLAAMADVFYANASATKKAAF